MAHILIPTDFSGNSLKAAQYAVQLFGVEGNTFTVLNSYMLPRGAASTMWSIDDLLAKESHEGVELFTARLREDPLLANAVLVAACEHGDLPNVVSRFNDDPDPPSLVVMGTQGASGLKEVLLGSNTADVIKRGGIPVLAVPQDTPAKLPQRIMVADDGGPVDPEATAILLKIARNTKAHVMVARVSTPDNEGQEPSGESAYAALLGDIPTSYHYLSGENVHAALNELAEKSNVDIVVVLHRQRGLFEQLFHRSTATKLAMHTHIPMLVLQQARH
jgi:nucleotide-binding universal stress UspA family protein